MKQLSEAQCAAIADAIRHVHNTSGMELTAEAWQRWQERIHVDEHGPRLGWNRNEQVIPAAIKDDIERRLFGVLP